MTVALTGARIFDGTRFVAGGAVLVEHGRVLAVVQEGAIPADAAREDLGGGLLAAGFVDLQVNGGGGALLNDAPTPATMARIAAAHRRFGTTGLLPTLITADAATTDAAVAAAGEASGTVAGVLGLHLEGPHLAPARRGAHDAALMRAMTEADADALIAARAGTGVLLVTVATEQVPPALVRRLADGGVIVSLGHTDAPYDAARAAFDAGARGVTHLFNAMSPLGHREPGLVGAALATGNAWCGVIADGHHVHAASLRLALRAKQGPGRLFLVTDAMATVGSDIASFTLGGRVIRRHGGRLTLADGTLAGADIDMAASVRWAVAALGLDVGEALRMASLYPAQLIGDATRGFIGPGARAAFVLLDEALGVRRCWGGDRDCEPVAGGGTSSACRLVSVAQQDRAQDS